MDIFLGLVAIIFLSVVINTVAGFGIALVAMPMLVPLVGLSTARPLMALLSFVSSVFILVYYKRELNFKAVIPLTVASLIGVPLGEILLSAVNEEIVTVGLGVLVIAYALYSLLSPQIPEIKREGWEWFYGGASGILSGAYNTGGPPLVIYAASRRWGPSEFRSNLHAVAIAKGMMVILTHMVAGNMTPLVFRDFLISLPAIIGGSFLGFAIADRLNPELFKNIVLVALIVLGVRLILS